MYFAECKYLHLQVIWTQFPCVYYTRMLCKFWLMNCNIGLSSKVFCAICWCFCLFQYCCIFFYPIIWNWLKDHRWKPISTNWYWAQLKRNKIHHEQFTPDVGKTTVDADVEVFIQVKQIISNSKHTPFLILYYGENVAEEIQRMKWIKVLTLIVLDTKNIPVKSTA